MFTSQEFCSFGSYIWIYDPFWVNSQSLSLSLSLSLLYWRLNLGPCACYAHLSYAPALLFLRQCLTNWDSWTHGSPFWVNLCIWCHWRTEGWWWGLVYPIAIISFAKNIILSPKESPWIALGPLPKLSWLCIRICFLLLIYLVVHYKFITCPEIR
jgi:hypothetical protein